MTDHNQALEHAKKYANSSQSDHANLCRAYLELVARIEESQKQEAEQRGMEKANEFNVTLNIFAGSPPGYENWYDYWENVSKTGTISNLFVADIAYSEILQKAMLSAAPQSENK